MSWIVTVLPLAGVALGSLGTLVGQYLSTRGDTRRERREQQNAQRTERKEAILEFLSAAQRAEFTADEITSGGAPEEAEIRERIHALWLAKKLPELVCSPETAQAAHDYTLALHTLLRGDPPPEGAPAKSERRHAFLESARRELGTASAPLRRSLDPHEPPPAISDR